MRDSNFIGYCRLHSDTELALFSGRDIKRLFALAGRDEPNVADDDFISVDLRDVCKEATERRNKQKKEDEERAYLKWVHAVRNETSVPDGGEAKHKQCNTQNPQPKEDKLPKDAIASGKKT